MEDHPGRRSPKLPKCKSLSLQFYIFAVLCFSVGWKSMDGSLECDEGAGFGGEDYTNKVFQK